MRADGCLPDSQTQRLGLEQGDIDVGFTHAVPDLKARRGRGGLPRRRLYHDPGDLDAGILRQVPGINAEIITGDVGQINGAMRDRSVALLVGRGAWPAATSGQQPARLCTTPDNASEAGLTNSRGWRTSHFDEELNGKSGTALVERNSDAQIAPYEKIQPIIDDKATSIQQLSERGVTAAYLSDVSGPIIEPLRFEEFTKHP
ncbi:hypothetical protein JF540_16230 [Salipiger thiooxidans]|uniref:hypothetical protein n=1 Tax=Salipiger thiooxidans TaxID=282683 RepID=UPI001A8D5400|nr:hypothetical protein [Salipiger thiooxidans]MBN8188240.1 hypothetical protein [Salipiger thiooxidans]